MAVEGILPNGVTEILKNLVSTVAQEIGSAWGIKDELKTLQRTLEMIIAVIPDAERLQVRDEAVRLWLTRLKEVAYDANGVMDEVSCKTMRRRENHSLKNNVTDFFTTSGPLAFHFKMAKKIKDINRRLDEITKDMDRFQLKNIPSSSSTNVAIGGSSERHRRPTGFFESQTEFVGREEDKDKLTKILTTASSSSESPSNNHIEKVPVVSIVGNGGIGKTTLAQHVYHDHSVDLYFDPKIWIRVSDDFDVYRLLADILESILEEKLSDLSNFDLLVRTVREQLTGKRYLLVLDDLCNEDAEQWERLQSSLIVGAQGSKILTTTRKRQVADVVKGSISPYFLEKLQADECWSIMEKKAFSPGGAVKNPNMTNIGKDIANICHGLPLAAIFLGSLMHSKNKESNWLSIRENDVWNTTEGQIMPILKFCYDNLSPHLQRCFSYCSIFPKDWKLSKQTIIQLWMAEGFLQPSNVGNECSFEDIGEEYFESLMLSSFFIGVEMDDLDDVKAFKMHDLVHDLAQAVVGDHECSTVKVSDHLELICEVRRLNLIMDKELSATFHKSIRKLNKLQTVIVLEPTYFLDLQAFSNNKHLRVLHLGRPAVEGSEIGHTNSKLRQLRYLHISSWNLSSNISDDDSFSRLYNLQTLVLSKCRLVQNFLKELGSLKHLRHLDISFTDIQELPDSVTSLHNLQSLDLNHCENFTTIPDSVTGLECLRFLDMSFTPIVKIPDFVTALCNLRTLDVNSCEKLKSLPEHVAGLANLSIFNFRNCPLLEALPKDFGALHQLRCLDLEGTAISVLPESCSTNLNNLEFVHLDDCEPPKEVTNWIKLRTFYYYHLATPKGIRELVWLRSLTYRAPAIVINERECYGIEELGNLNFLEVITITGLLRVTDPTDAERANLKAKQNLLKLSLHWDEIEGGMPAWYWERGSYSFQVFEALQPPTGLRNLTIWNFMGCDLPTWMCVSSCLPDLVWLELRNCRNIEQLPAAIGQLPGLRSLCLTGMIFLRSLDIGGFLSLVVLKLKNMVLLEDLGYPYPYLHNLKIVGCKRLEEIPSFPSLWQLVLKNTNHRLVCSVGGSQTSLTHLFLENIEDLVYFPISILQNNRNLQILSIKECNRFEGFGVNDGDRANVVSLHGPDPHRVSLQKLGFIDCPVLKFLPDLRGWTSLQHLTIFRCPQVKDSLTYDMRDLSFLKYLFVDYIQRDEQRGDPSSISDLINLME